MKRALVLALLAAGIAGASVLGVRAMADEAGERAAEPEQATVAMEVQGMQSTMCEIQVRSALENLDGVTAVAVDRARARAEVTFDPSAVSPAALAAAVNALGYRASLPPGTAGADDPDAGTGTPTDGHPAGAAPLTPEQVERVAAFVAERMMASEVIPSGEEIAEATGVAPSESDTPALRAAVVARLAADPRGQRLLAGNRCSDYGACSLWGNLATASGELLALYEREKASDGATYADLALPPFEARTLAGESVRSADLAGRPAVITFLAVPCSHARDTVPILQELHRRYAGQGLQVVGVVVNSGPVEDVAGWVPTFAPEYPVWVVDDAALGDLIDSHLVPTTLLVDGGGKVRKKLVGFKDRQALLADLALIHRAGA